MSGKSTCSDAVHVGGLRSNEARVKPLVSTPVLGAGTDPWIGLGLHA